MNTKFEIGSQVIRTKGDYVVGRIGNVIDIDPIKNRVQVEWTKQVWGTETVNMAALKTWVKADCVELTSTPYRLDFYTHKIGYTATKYIRL